MHTCNVLCDSMTPQKNASSWKNNVATNLESFRIRNKLLDCARLIVVPWYRFFILRPMFLFEQVVARKSGPQTCPINANHLSFPKTGVGQGCGSEVFVNLLHKFGCTTERNMINFRKLP